MADSAMQAAIIDFLSQYKLHSRWMQNVPLNRYTTLHIGGPADILMEVASEEDARVALRACEELGAPLTILGNGSNVLVSDWGIRGLTLHMGEAFSELSQDGTLLEIQAGATLQKLCNAAADASLSGLEFASGIPGSVGGAVFMNAGAYGEEMKNVVDSVRVMDRGGRITTLAKEELAFSYRHSALMDTYSGSLLLSAKVRLTEGSEDIIRLAMKGFSLKRKEKQPLQLPSCGSTFKRPEGNFAGTLIEQCGLKGFRVGGCSVSTLHAGFLVNDQGGTAADYLELIRRVQSVVLEKTGVQLEPEVRFLGETPEQAR